MTGFCVNTWLLQKKYSCPGTDGCSSWATMQCAMNPNGNFPWTDYSKPTQPVNFQEGVWQECPEGYVFTNYNECAPLYANQETGIAASLDYSQTENV